MFNSIRVRFTLIYFMLVFIVMVLAGVFITYSFEVYNHSIVSNRLDDISDIMMRELHRLADQDLVEKEQLIQEAIDRHAAIGLREEIYIVDLKSQEVVATSTAHTGRQASDVLEIGVMIEALSGNIVEKDNQIYSGVYTKDKLYPIVFNNEQWGIMYLRYDLSDIQGSLARVRLIILQSIVMSLFLTIGIGAVLSKRITDPINEVTFKAIRLAQGDFNQFVEVKSDDEIGTLSETFNFLSKELKKNLSEISREKSKLEAIINYMEDGLVAINASGDILHYNPKALKMLNMKSYFDESFIGDLLSIYSSSVNDSGIGFKRMTYRDKVLQVNFAPFLDELSNRVGVVFVFQDITEEDRLENMRREFVANVSHELKTPLTSIKSYTETILDGAIEDIELTKSFLSVVNDEADRMNRLVKDLLDLSHFDSSMVGLNLSRISMHDLIEKCVFKVKLTAEQEGLKIQTYYEDLGVYAEVDSGKIEQLILNILSNAIKYSESGDMIEVDLRNGRDEGYFEIVVKDHGMGIPEEDLERIFERFYRVDKARSRERGGTGLGLSIAKEIVRAHKGDLRVDSQFGEGTQVTIALPYDLKNV